MKHSRWQRRVHWAILPLLVAARAHLALTALGLGPAAAARADLFEWATNERPEPKVDATTDR